MPLNMAPWIGRQYGRSDLEENRFGFRLLVVGESHYKTKQDPQPWFGLTTGVVERRVGGGNRQRAFFTPLTEVLTRNRDIHPSDFAVWHEVAFYNYIQSFKRNGITRHQLEEARAPWQVVLEYLQPEAVFVASRLVGRAIEGNGLPEGIEFDMVDHPRSSRQTIDKRIEVFRRLVNRVTQR